MAGVYYTPAVANSNPVETNETDASRGGLQALFACGMRTSTKLWLLATLLVAALESVHGGPIWNEATYLSCVNMRGSCPSLALAGSSLTGTLPTEIGRLTSVTMLRLTYNGLTGSIPTELGLLTELSDLRLSQTSLSGSLPTEIGRMTSMKLFRLGAIENLTGSIPTEIGRLTSALQLYLYGNQLTGSMPSELGLLTALRELSLEDNHLTGSIPSELGDMPSLTELCVSRTINPCVGART